MSHLDRYVAERRAYLKGLLESETIGPEAFAYGMGQIEVEKFVTGTPLERLDWANSYSRMPALLDLYGRRDFWSLLGKRWTQCDNVSDFIEALLPIFRTARRHAPMRSAMSVEERRVYEGLPNVVTIWRGCYESVNEYGFSWTLSKDVAIKFPNLRRYKIPDGTPLLLEGQIEKRRILFYANGRAEQEVVVVPEDVMIREEHYLPAETRPEIEVAT